MAKRAAATRETHDLAGRGGRDRRFTEPTIEGIDYPTLGVSRAHNDPTDGVLHVETYAATSGSKGAPTSWRVTRRPDTRAVAVRYDGAEFPHRRVVSTDTVEIASTVDHHVFRIAAGAGTAPYRPAAPAGVSVLCAGDGARHAGGR